MRWSRHKGSKFDAEGRSVYSLSRQVSAFFADKTTMDDVATITLAYFSPDDAY